MDTILHVVDVPAPPSDVFQALTTREGLSRWWTTTVKVELPEIEFTFVPGVFNPRMRVEEAREPVAVAWTCIGGAEQWIDARISFDIRQHEGGSRLVFRQGYGRGLDDESYGIYNFNWGHYLASLRAYCETGMGTPFQASRLGGPRSPSPGN